MIFIYGGAYQGKLEFAKERFGLSDGDIYYCSDADGFLTAKKCINGYHSMILSQLDAGVDPLGYLSENAGLLKDKIIICDDISSGVVPMGEDMRRFREAAGRCATFLSKNADEVWRVFCGIGTQIK